MNIVFVRLIICLSISFFFNGILFSQNARILQLDNSNAYQLIERFIESGRFTNLNPTKLPYTHSEVYFELERLNYDALSEIEKVWYNLLKEEILYSDEKRSKEYNFEPYILLASDFNNSERKNVYRPTSNDYYVWPFGETGFITDYKGFTINTNVYFDLYYEFAPDGLDPTNRLYIRNEDSYVIGDCKEKKQHLFLVTNQHLISLLIPSALKKYPLQYCTVS